MLTTSLSTRATPTPHTRLPTTRISTRATPTPHTKDAHNAYIDPAHHGLHHAGKDIHPTYGGADTHVFDAAPNEAAGNNVVETLALMLDNITNIDSYAVFETAKDMHKQLSDVYSKDLPNVKQDPTFQASDEAMTHYKDLLVEAIKNTSDILEAANRFEVKRVEALKTHQVQILAWTILDALVEAHQGRLGVEGYIKDHKLHFEVVQTFEERFTNLYEVLKLSKAMVHGAMPASFLARMVAAPGH
ncbi:hypothetical protein QBC34DRAFT_470600 [Podospora aff. communis PSN243]|uniref:Uncharacterized protein n=1 Tax=Podospora aff. communis PSN243 TaxID=3040156 RepID=A0AAV9GFA3_9PEZI|nr:hypothetical protein QBC34DRAFT_470600 [Podospora aff. communis PSN243]